MKKQMTCILLLTTMLLSCFSCASETDQPAQTSASAVTEPVTAAETAEPEVIAVKDDLPNVSYDGFTYKILTRENNSHYRMLVEEETGEVFNDAIFKRNINIAERFDIDFEESYYVDPNYALQLVKAGDDVYQLMHVRCSAANTMAQKKYCYPVTELSYIDLSKPYWDAELTASIAIGNKPYFALGAANLSTIDFMMVLLFNKNLAAEYNIPNLYETVNNGDWTFERFGEIAAQVTNDLNGDSVYDDQDIWGALGTSKYLHCSLIQAGGALYINKDADDYPYYNMGSDEHFINVYTRIFEILHDNNAWYLTSDYSNEAPVYNTMFRNNQGLFYTTMFYYVGTLRDMESEFGIIPFPKYDDKQENYYTRVCFFDAGVIPVTVQDPDRASIIYEAMNCESYNMVVPAYKEIALKTKYTRDEESSAMIDLMFANRILDIGDSYLVDHIRDGFMYNMFIAEKRDIVSTAAKLQSRLDKELAKLIEAYQE